MALIPQLPGFKVTDEGRHTLTILSLFALGGLLYLSLFNLAGQVGFVLTSFLEILFGKGKYFAPSIFFIAAFLMMRIEEYKEELEEDFNPRMFWGCVLLLMVGSGFLNLFNGVVTVNQSPIGGGLVGYALYPFALGFFGKIGGGFILTMLLLAAWFIVSQMTFSRFMQSIMALPTNPGKFWDTIPDLFEVWKPPVDEDEIQGKNEEQKVAPTKTDTPKRNYNKSVPVEEEPTVSYTPEGVIDVRGVRSKVTGTPQNTSARPKTKFNFSKTEEGILDMEAVQTASVNWNLPPFTLLSESKTLPESGDIEANKEIIKDTFAHFGIKVEMRDTFTGPTVTQYTLKPANGVKLSTIDALNRDLALALAARHLRIEAPIPGQSLVGVEIPNKKKTTVSLREILQTYDFIESKDDLPVAIGKDVSGKTVVYPITKMPHLLVAGATNSGKSIWLQGALISLLYRYSYQELKMILVDMKRVELSLYSKIPHLLSPVITEPDKAINALKWTVLEMQRRYTLLEESMTRNIKEYNKLVGKDSGKALPYLVFVIDELGDLMLLAKAEAEPLIVRLTQMARAVGIHLILATQRPDTGVITGLIKANVPTRLSFAVASNIDSRVILDSSGAEKLLGQGDGLFLSPDLMQPRRIQAAYVSEQEVKAVVNFLIEQANENGVGYDPTITETPKTTVNIPGLHEDSVSSGDTDDRLDEAREIVIDTGKASASFLQRMMSIGYARAARILDLLEAEGTIGPSNGAKPRDVYGYKTAQNKSPEEEDRFDAEL
ncbi:MAG: DNA translocase FtsK [Patescibacteria group bacterium]